ncbi:hypothetical protein Gura_0839 [Geotalea uraniireducens Rf4]|uniref:Leucine rich repeat variant n=1 Tax=Geotalea uraniireducens (strain Rf4) TaxID=351605 RepID=A5GBJ0_GEOUR|nr:hypothetical protein Gura_0839 [Geotalea uraniireducens Rf4]
MEDSAKIATFGPNLSHQLHHALTADKNELRQVLQSPSMEVLRAALKNPSLDEAHLLALLERRDLSEELLKAVFSLPAVGESHNLKVAVVRNPNTPGQVTLALLPHLYLFELVTICYLPGVTPDQKLAAERAVIQRLPGTPLGNKLTLARRGTANIIEALLREGDAQIIDACLTNPRIKESAIFQFLSSAKASAETISLIARHPRWKTRPNLITALLRNQKTPVVWYNLFLPTLNTAEIRNLLASQRLSQTQKVAVEEELKRRGQR